MAHLFAYGTLMDERVMAAVAGGRPRRRGADLSGAERRAVRGERYPGLIRSSRGVVRGILYYDLDERAWARLDRFEGALYERRPVAVRLRGGAAVRAETYFVRRACHAALSGEPWAPDRFSPRARALFEKAYDGYRWLEADSE
jgi:gamma-glutamylcyclotransferase (GGCT)/AIG2-like uncharacterized protein YtfP